MKHVRARLIGALAIAVPLAIILSTGCATAGHDPRYDGDAPDASPSDNPILVLVHIENHRTIDATPPNFYLTGSGRHSLGIVEGMGGKLDRLIDSAWLGADGCATITAHYPGYKDLVYDRLCWRKGEKIDVTLDNIFVPVAAWAHR